MNEEELHHVGLACRSIDIEFTAMRRVGAVPDGDEFVDAELGIRGRFVRLGTARIELLEEWEGSGVLAPWLHGSARIYHLAYLTDDLSESLAGMESGSKLIRPPQPAVAFDGRRVAFLITPSLLLLELIER